MSNLNVKYKKFPSALEIQTASYCNSRCIICPHASISKKENSGIMSMGLFKKIIDQVKANPGIKIIPYLNNEPFLDPFFLDRLKYININCKNSEIEISTNVSKLDKGMQEKLLGTEIGELRLSLFGFSEEGHKQAMPGLNWAKVKKNLDDLLNFKSLRKNIKKISLIMIDYPGLKKEDMRLAKNYCKKHDIEFNFWGFLDRAGNVVNFSNRIMKKNTKGCEQNRPLERMHITFKGDVILCSMDWKWEYKIGNLNKDTIETVWNSKKYDKFREAIYLGENPPDLCKKCKLSL